MIPKSHVSVRPSRRARGGFALLAALFCLIMLSLAVSSTVSLLIDELHVTQLAEKKLQSRSLASAGLQMAAMRLERDPDFRGETWQLAVDKAPAGDLLGTIETTIEPLAKSAGRCRITVIAVYPSDAVRSVRTRLAVLAPIPTGESNEQ